VRDKTLFFTTTVVTDTQSRATPDTCGAANGSLAGTTLRWSTPVRGYRTDGKLTCQGSLCGSFGAPPEGTSGFRVAAHPVTFRSFEMSDDLHRFTMPLTFVSKTEHPKQTAYLTLAGTEVRRSCVATPPCAGR
jgi:hypothetical protein